MNLAIKGHPTHGKEVIELLEMMGGKNIHRIDAIRDYYVYFVMDDKNKTISSLKLNQVLPEEFIIYSLEEFLEKFPYKVGDKVQHKGATSCGSIFEVEEMRWEENTVKYTLCLFGCNYKRSTLPVEYLQPYKEETMEEKEPEPKAPILSNRYDYAEGKCGYVIPDGYEFDYIKEGFQTEIILRPIKSPYPKTYEKCCEVLSIAPYYNVKYHTFEHGFHELATSNKLLLLQDKLNILSKLLICRDAYWKIAGEQMGLGKDWKPDFTDTKEMYYIFYKGYIEKGNQRHPNNHILIFPTPEMRDAFYENFKDLIEQCKELL